MDTKSIEKANVKKSPAQQIKQRNEPVSVAIRIVFLRLGKIDTQEEKFEAHVVLEAQWLLRSNDAKNELISSFPTDLQTRFDDGDMVKLPKEYPETNWHPQLFLLNVGHDSDEEIKYSVKKRGSEIQIRESREVYGKFYTKFDLHHFPTDIQELSVTVGSALYDTDVVLRADSYRPSGINREAFVAQQEWALYDHVVSRNKFMKGFLFQNDDDDKLDTPGHERQRSILNFSCHAARRSTYFYWNGYCLIFLITLIAFSSFAIPPNTVQNRIPITCTLLLTSIAFRWTISNSLPNVAYLTTIDRYAIVSILVLVILCAWHSIIGTIVYIRNHYDALAPDSYWSWVDRNMFFALIGLYMLVHLTMGIWHWRVPLARRHHMLSLDKQYNEEVKRCPSNGQSSVISSPDQRNRDEQSYP